MVAIFLLNYQIFFSNFMSKRVLLEIYRIRDLLDNRKSDISSDLSQSDVG